MIPRTLFKPEHDEFRRNVRRFLETECTPHRERWEEQQHVDRAIWNRAGSLGMLCMTMPEEYGGAGADRAFSVVLMEELMYAGNSSIGFVLHNDIVANYLNNFGSDAQKRLWLPQMANGEVVGAIAMTEPGTGSDLQAVKTRAIVDGDDYVINGSKIFITNGYLCDLVVVVAKTGDATGGAENVSLLLVEADRKGIGKGKPLKKIGMKGQDTCELFFDDVRVPRANLLGDAGTGFFALMKELAWERLIIAINAIAAFMAALTGQKTYQKAVAGISGAGDAAVQHLEARLFIVAGDDDGEFGPLLHDRTL